MFRFLIKKWFYDCWDNMLRIVLYNVAFTALILILLFLFRSLFPENPTSILILVYWIVIGLLFAIVALIIAILSSQMLTILKTNPQVQTMLAEGRQYYRSATLLGFAQWLHITLLLIAVPFYSDINMFIASVAIGVLFWVSLAWQMIIQFFFPITMQLSNSPIQAIKKAAIMFFDNTIFSVGVFCGGIVIILISVVTMFMFPGITGLLLWQQETIYLRLKKYDYLEQNDNKNIPWHEILTEERERLGHRTLRNFIFPWKN